MHHLPRIVPLVDGLIDVESLVTLQPNQLGVENLGEDFGDLGLPHARLSFQKKRSLELQGEIHRRRETTIGNIQFFPELRLERLDGSDRQAISAVSLA